MRRNCLGLMLLLLMAGCATAPPPPNLPRPAPPFPADAMVTQRAVLTIHGRQFALNGYTLLSATNGLRLIMTENFGHVLADVLVKPDGSVQVVQAARPFRPEWVRRYVAADLVCLFGHGPETNCPGRWLGPTHFLIERRGYTLDLNIVETKPGLQPPELLKGPGKTTP